MRKDNVKVSIVPPFLMDGILMVFKDPDLLYVSTLNYEQEAVLIVFIKTLHMSIFYQ